MRTYVYGGHLKQWLPTPSRAKSEMALYPNIFVMTKSKCVPNVMLLSQNAQFIHIAAGLNVNLWPVPMN